MKCFQLMSFIIHYSVQKWFSLTNQWPFVSYWCLHFSDYMFLPIQKIILTLGILNSFVIYMWMSHLSKFSCKVQLLLLLLLLLLFSSSFFFLNFWSQSIISISVGNLFGFTTWKLFNPPISVRRNGYMYFFYFREHSSI